MKFKRNPIVVVGLSAVLMATPVTPAFAAGDEALGDAYATTTTTTTNAQSQNQDGEMGIADLNHRGQLENIKKLVKIAQDEKRIITVTGFADSQTGNELLNEKLAARRADTIVKELLEMGVDSHQIRIVNGGGVNTLDIVPANRRVVVSLGGQYADPQVSE